MNRSVVNPSLRAIFGVVFAATLGLSISACSGDKDGESTSGKVLAVDRVDAAADLARKNGPAAEKMEFEETAPMPTAEGEAVATAEPEAAATDVKADTDAKTDDAAPEMVAASANGDGEALYNKQCMACHATGLLNAPKYGDKEAWAPRIAKGKETLYTHAAKGFNQMNAQVNAEVNEEQVHAAVDYMVAAAS